MEILLLIAAGLGLGLVFDVFDSNGAADEPDPVVEPEDEPIERVLIEGDDDSNTLGSIGSEESLEIDGKGGIDQIRAGSGSDLIYGGDGDDFITTRSGDDTVFGGSGNDRINGSSLNPPLDENGDLPDGYSDNDVIYGGDGSDRISGGGYGSHTLFGGNGADTLQTSSFDRDDARATLVGPDTLYGGDGFDRLTSWGSGGDVLYGGDDPDTFWTNLDPTVGPSNILMVDDSPMVIADFNPSEDSINLEPYQNAVADESLLSLVETGDGDVMVRFDGIDRALVLNVTLSEMQSAKITFRDA